jgi:hypothetical protein
MVEYLRDLVCVHNFSTTEYVKLRDSKRVSFIASVLDILNTPEYADCVLIIEEREYVI